MSASTLAIANCRVSSDKQLENNSLSRQKKAVLKAAKDLGVTIPDDGWWSGSVSSMRGKNVIRKDLKEMIERCKKNKRIKYLIVDEPDRFMRSIDEAAYFEVTFRQLGVTVWYASDPDLNKGDLSAKLIKFTKYLAAEGSNEERQRKSINGQAEALKQGLWTFHPKPGYKKGKVKGVPEILKRHGLPLRNIMSNIVGGHLTPPQGLIEYNKIRVVVGKSPIKMDKFRTILTDPFYAGILEVDKQVKVRNVNGKHEPLISIETHNKLVKIMDQRKKNQAGPRKNGNPKYPGNNLITHDTCLKHGCGKLVGFDHGNGKIGSKVYEKYRCRTNGCGEYWTREEIHDQIKKLFSANPITDKGLADLSKALEVVWKQAEGQAEQEENRITYKINNLNTLIEQQVEAATDPSNAEIKAKILAVISKKEAEVAKLEDQLVKLREGSGSDKEEFLAFAFDFIQNMGSRFLEISQDNRLKCKQVVFPAGFHVNANKKVYTPEISPLYSLATNKKDTEVSDFTHMVRVTGL